MSRAGLVCQASSLYTLFKRNKNHPCVYKGEGQPGWEFSCNCTHRASLSLKFWKFHAALQVCLVGCIALPCVIESIMYSLSFENIVFHSCGLQLCKLIGTKECVYIKNESNSHRIVSRDQPSGRDFMSKGSISC